MTRRNTVSDFLPTNFLLDLSAGSYDRAEWASASAVERGSCEEWQGPRHSDGYGRSRYRGIKKLVHRVVWEEAYGPITDLNLCVLHHCDNPPCYRLRHLFLGSQIVNVADMKAKGRARSARGVDNPKAKLTAADVRSIRSRCVLGTGRKQGPSRGNVVALSVEFEVTPRVIRLVFRRKSYVEVDE